MVTPAGVDPHSGAAWALSQGGSNRTAWTVIVSIFIAFVLVTTAVRAFRDRHDRHDR